MKIGLMGLGRSGKTTVFKTMTGLAVPVGFGGELRYGIVRVPDQRIEAPSRIFSPEKTTYAEMTFSDRLRQDRALSRTAGPCFTSNPASERDGLSVQSVATATFVRQLTPGSPH